MAQPNVSKHTGMAAVAREFFFDAIKDGRFRVARCTRRAMKTTSAAIKILVTNMLTPRGVSLYVTISTTALRDQIWPILKAYVAEYDLPFEFNETQLRMQHKLSTGRAIFRGASDTSQIDKLRGLKLMLAIFDESGTFGAEMEKLVFSVISPGLRDQGGELLLIGTPGYFPEGLFYEASEGFAHRANWVRRRWTLQENPFLTDHAKSMKAIMAEDGLTADDPVFIREWLGQYCLNTKVQMFEYDPARNGFRGPPPSGLSYYLGVDFGWTDETAIVALGWNPTSRKMYAVESWAQSEQTSDQVAEHLLDFIARYRPLRIIGDTGGYGKGPAEQIYRDYGIYIEQAKKLEKLNHVEFMNSAFRRADLLVNLDDKLSYELPRVLWAEDKKDSHNTAKDNRCFVAGTPVATPWGPRPIENLQIGDIVRTSKGPRRVTQAWSSGIQPTMTLTFADGARLTCTASHPFWTDRGWIQAHALLDTDVLHKLDSADPTARLRTSVVSRKLSAPQEVFDIEVDDAHEFYANGILVSNSHSLLYAWREANNIAGKTALVKLGFNPDELIGWPEHELRAKLGPNYGAGAGDRGARTPGSGDDAPANLLWFLKSV